MIGTTSAIVDRVVESPAFEGHLKTVLAEDSSRGFTSHQLVRRLDPDTIPSRRRSVSLKRVAFALSNHDQMAGGNR